MGPTVAKMSSMLYNRSFSQTDRVNAENEKMAARLSGIKSSMSSSRKKPTKKMPTSNSVNRQRAAERIEAENHKLAMRLDATHCAPKPKKAKAAPAEKRMTSNALNRLRNEERIAAENYKMARRIAMSGHNMQPRGVSARTSNSRCGSRSSQRSSDKVECREREDVQALFTREMNAMAMCGDRDDCFFD